MGSVILGSAPRSLCVYSCFHLPGCAGSLRLGAVAWHPDQWVTVGRKDPLLTPGALDALFQDRGLPLPGQVSGGRYGGAQGLEVPALSSTQ